MCLLSPLGGKGLMGCHETKNQRHNRVEDMCSSEDLYGGSVVHFFLAIGLSFSTLHKNAGQNCRFCDHTSVKQDDKHSEFLLLYQILCLHKVLPSGVFFFHLGVTFLKKVIVRLC